MKNTKPKKYALFYLLTYYKKEKMFSFFYFICPLLLTITLILLKNVFGLYLGFTILTLVEYIQISFPTLIGFVIAGYAILTTFSNDKYLSKIVEFEKESNDNYYLQISSIFGWSVLVQVIGIIFTLIVKMFYPLNHLVINIETVNYIYFTRSILKSIIESILLFILFYSFFQLVAIVLNLFMWTKSFHDYLKNESE